MITESIIKKLSTDDFNFLKSLVTDEEKRRKTRVETVDLIIVDDGCDPFFMEMDDFEKCARKKEHENDWDLIDYIESTLYNGLSVSFSFGTYDKSSIAEYDFFNKENPYIEFLNED